MILSGTVLVDSSTIMENSAVIVSDSEITALGERDSILSQYPDHNEHSYDISSAVSVDSIGRT